MNACQIYMRFTLHLTFLISPEIRAPIHFLWLKDLLNAEISREIDYVYVEWVIGLRAIQKWIHHFEDGDYNLEDGPRTHHLRSIEDVSAIRTLLADNPSLLQKIAYIRNNHQKTVKHILRDNFSLRKINFKWIPRLLDDNQKLEKFESQQSSWSPSNQNRDMSLRLYIHKMKHGFIPTIRDLPYGRMWIL
jgi:hypothetical protein